MKLCQFKTNNSDRQRLGVLIGDDIVSDVAELARAAKNAGSTPADWLLEAGSTMDVIRRGSSATQDLASLLEGGPRPAQGHNVAYAIDSIEFLPATYPS